ncbi:MAG: M48 family metalloprotease [Elusimicrobia bacterium]|nr:M48 family metalloprotease [Elusimicrobiota bacterium]
MKRILPLVLVSAFAGVALLLTRHRDSPSRESLLPALRAVQQHEKQVERAAGRVLLLTPEEERRIGAEFDGRMSRTLAPGTPRGEAARRADEGLVNEVGRSLARAAVVERFPGRYEFRVIHGRPGNNAFAAPGGYVYVLPDLVRRFRRAPAALAFVLGHEIGHVELSHCADGARAKEWLAKLGLAPVGDAAALLRTLAQFHFSEVQEMEADEFALLLLRATRQDPFAALQALDLLDLPPDQETKRDPGEIAWEGLSDYLRTHPRSWERRNRIRRRLESWSRGR